MIQNFVEAVRFLTILPLPSRPSKEEGSLAAAMFFFPLVGFLLGVISLALYFLAARFYPPPIATLVLVIAPLLLSGALHVDGFADFCDGFGAGKNKEETLRIMRDPHMGVWGTAGVSLLLLTKFMLLLDLPLKFPAFLFAMTASRWSQVVLSYFLPYARVEGGLGRGVARKVSLKTLLGASFFLFLIVVYLGWIGFFAALALGAFLFLVGYFFHCKLSGITGDLLGAASEMTELLIFLAVTAIAPYLPL
jgi:adenosylcobinamide-GDP ribazoletransferase